MTTINIGCGSDGWGDVKLDYTRAPKEYYLVNNKSSANLLADAQHLPFIDKCFSELRAYHVLEHIRDWEAAIKEWCRIAKRVKIRVPTDSNSAVICLKNFFQNVDLGQVNFLLLNNLKSLMKLREQAIEHLWQIDPRKVVDNLISRGFEYYTVRKINMPVFQLKLPFLNIDISSMKLMISHSWDIEAW